MALDLPKPNDFLLGVNEVFTVLIPGAAAVVLLKLAWPALPIARELDTVGAAFAFVLAYIFGNSLRVAGAMLEDVVDRWHRGRTSARFEHLFARMKTLRQGDDEQSSGVNHLKFARSVLQREDAAAWLEVQRSEADAKLFRSLVVLSLVALPTPVSLSDSRRAWVAVMVVAVVITAFAYHRMRWRAVYLALAHFIALHPVERKGSEAAPPAAARRATGA